MSTVPTFAEFVKAYFPEEKFPKFNMLHVERISELLEKVKPGEQLVITGGRYKPLYLNLISLYDRQKDNGLHADTLIVDDCIAMPSRLHLKDASGHVFKNGALPGLKHIKLDDE